MLGLRFWIIIACQTREGGREKHSTQHSVSVSVSVSVTSRREQFILGTSSGASKTSFSITSKH